MEILEIIAVVVLCGIALGIISTVAFIAAVFIMREPDADDHDDVEIREYKFWNKNK